MSTPKRYSKSYRDNKISRRPVKRSWFGARRAKPRRMRSESDRAGALVWGGRAGRRRPRQFIFPAVNKGLVSGMVILLLFVVWAGIILFSPFFGIQNIRVTGLKNITYNEVSAVAREYLSGRSFKIFQHSNYFTASSETLQNLIQSRFYLQNIQISKIFPNTIQIDIQEKTTSVIYDNGSKYVILDLNGTVIKDLKACTDECVGALGSNANALTDTSSSIDLAAVTSTPPNNEVNVHRPKFDSFALEYLNVPVVYDKRHLPLSVGEHNVLSADIISKLLNIYNKAKKSEKLYALQYFVLDTPGGGVEAVTNQGFAVYFNPDQNLDAQFNNVRVVLKDNQPTSYIDVRYAERVFWK